MDEKGVPEEMPKFDETLKNSTIFPISMLKNETLTDSKGNIISVSDEDYQMVATILNTIGKQGYNISGVLLLMKLCRIALKKCTLVGRSYNF